MIVKTSNAILLAFFLSLTTFPAAAQLDISDNQVWGQGINGVPDRDENRDAFGQDVAIGDFDGDGIEDLAVSSPGENDAKGVVHVIYGADRGLSGVGVQEWRQGGDLGGNDEDDDNFGFSLAAGDFNGDGFDDLAVSAPGEDGLRGNVQIIYGSANRLTAQGTQIWDQDDLEGSGRERGDQFGLDLATGDFNGDGYDDLAVGTPLESSAGGLVNVIYGSAGGLTGAGNQRWRQGADNIRGGREDGDLFGLAVAAGDTNGDGYDELIVGVPGEDDAKGQFQVIFGSASGLISNGNQRWIQEEDGLPDDKEDGDGFGEVLTTGDFNNDGYDDIAASALGENGGAGVVIVVPGSPSGPDGNRSERWRQGEDPGEIRAPEGREDGDRFGSSLAVGDFDRDSFQDLAIGSRGEDGNRGIVVVLYGTMGGLNLDGWQLFIQGLDGLQGQALTGESFGFAMAAGDIGFDFADDLVVSAPGEPGGNARGIVHAIYGIATGAPTISAVVGAGLSVPPVDKLAYNSLATIFGFNFYPEGQFRVVSANDLVAGRLPTVVDDVCVEINGRRTPITAVFPNQINFQANTLPNENNAEVEVVLNCGLPNEFRSMPVSVEIAPAAPQFFFFVQNQNGRNPVAAVNNSTGQLLGRPNLVPGGSFVPARPGDIVLVFLTGLGETSPRFDPGELPGVAGQSLRQVELRLGGVPVPLIYAGVTPGFAGLYQIAFEVPANALAGDLEIVVVSRSGGSVIESPSGAFLTVER